MKRLLQILILAGSTPAFGDVYQIAGSVSDGFAGPAVGAMVTLCDYGHPEGFSATVAVPESGVVDVVFPYLPSAVAFDVSGDPTFRDVHVLVGAPVCPVSPCPPIQGGTFEIHLQRRDTAALPVGVTDRRIK